MHSFIHCNIATAESFRRTVSSLPSANQRGNIRSFHSISPILSLLHYSMQPYQQSTRYMLKWGKLEGGICRYLVMGWPIVYGSPLNCTNNFAGASLRTARGDCLLPPLTCTWFLPLPVHLLHLPSLSPPPPHTPCQPTCPSTIRVHGSGDPLLESLCGSGLKWLSHGITGFAPLHNFYVSRTLVLRWKTPVMSIELGQIKHWNPSIFFKGRES